MVALMTLETALKAASMQRMPTPKTTEGMPPSAAMAAVGVMRTAGTAAPAAISRGVPRSCACGPGAPRKATLRSATNATSATHSVISLDERAMAKPLQSWQSKTHPHLSRKCMASKTLSNPIRSSLSSHLEDTSCTNECSVSFIIIESYHDRSQAERLCFCSCYMHRASREWWVKAWDQNKHNYSKDLKRILKTLAICSSLWKLAHASANFGPEQRSHISEGKIRVIIHTATDPEKGFVLGSHALSRVRRWR